MKQNVWKPILASTLFVVAVGWLYFVWVPMMQQDNQIDPEKVIRDSQAAIDSVRTELQEIQTGNSESTSSIESSERETAAPK